MFTILRMRSLWETTTILLQNLQAAYRGCIKTGHSRAIDIHSDIYVIFLIPCYFGYWPYKWMLMEFYGRSISQTLTPAAHNRCSSPIPGGKYRPPYFETSRKYQLDCNQMRWNIYTFVFPPCWLVCGLDAWREYIIRWMATFYTFNITGVRDRIFYSNSSDGFYFVRVYTLIQSTTFWAIITNIFFDHCIRW